MEPRRRRIMHLEADAVIPYSREIVFRTYRDELTTLVEFLPNVREIHRISAEGSPAADGSETNAMTHEWLGGGEVPVAIQRIIDDSVFRWVERVIWDESRFVAKWEIQTEALKGAFRCVGRHTFVELEESTRLETSGEMHLDLATLAGGRVALPGFVADGLGRALQQLVARQIGTNLLNVSDALTRYLAAQTIA